MKERHILGCSTRRERRRPCDLSVTFLLGDLSDESEPLRAGDDARIVALGVKNDDLVAIQQSQLSQL
jgi:hypothetical protein